MGIFRHLVMWETESVMRILCSGRDEEFLPTGFVFNLMGWGSRGYKYEVDPWTFFHFLFSIQQDIILYIYKSEVALEAFINLMLSFFYFIYLPLSIYFFYISRLPVAFPKSRHSLSDDDDILTNFRCR